VFRNKRGMRKIVLSTNIAESSLTIPDVEVVIDFCLTKNLNSDPLSNYVKLNLEWADGNSAVQASLSFAQELQTFNKQFKFPSSEKAVVGERVRVITFHVNY